MTARNLGVVFGRMLSPLLPGFYFYGSRDARRSDAYAFTQFRIRV